MMFITEKPPPNGRAGKHTGRLEAHLSEAAVMLAVAQWMFERGAENVCVHPDGMHARQFDICGWLKKEPGVREDFRERKDSRGGNVRPWSPDT